MMYEASPPDLLLLRGALGRDEDGSHDHEITHWACTNLALVDASGQPRVGTFQMHGMRALEPRYKVPFHQLIEADGAFDATHRRICCTRCTGLGTIHTGALRACCSVRPGLTR